MRPVSAPFILWAMLSPSHVLLSQERFDTGPHKGFLKSPTEQIIVEIQQPYRVKSVHGIIRDATGHPLPETDFEIRDSYGRVQGSKTDRFGRFKISNISSGDYIFKATRNGFQSVVGKITVSKKFDTDPSIQLAMPIGA